MTAPYILKQEISSDTPRDGCAEEIFNGTKSQSGNEFAEIALGTSLNT
jgi:hypothetical protein